MKRWLLVVVVVTVAALLLGCGYGQWKIVSKFDADEYPVYRVRQPGGAVYDAIPILGGGKHVPPVGVYCKQINGSELDCGRCYTHLRIIWPSPV